MLDATQSLRILALLAEVTQSVAPEDAELPLTGLEVSSAAATVTPAGVSDEALLELVTGALTHPSQLSRRLRGDLTEAYRTRSSYGIEGFGVRHEQQARPFDEQAYHRFKRSLARPTGWASVTGEVRSVGRAQGGLSGTIRSELVGNVIHFEAPADLEDPLRETLFRRALVSGETEVDHSGATKRVVVERVELLGEHQRLTDLDLTDMTFDSEATLQALRELRRG